MPVKNFSSCHSSRLMIQFPHQHSSSGMFFRFSKEGFPMKRRIGILTSGGDCPGLNACIRGVARASYSLFDVEIVGIQDGYS